MFSKGNVCFFLVTSGKICWYLGYGTYIILLSFGVRYFDRSY